jgi:transcriptional regulator with XRE-family HTH domain
MNKHAEARALEETADVLTCIGRRIRQLRTEKKLTLQALGERTGLSTSMLSLLERGKTGPSIGTLVVIASALEAQMSDLLRPNPAGIRDSGRRRSPDIET